MRAGKYYKKYKIQNQNVIDKSYHEIHHKYTPNVKLIFYKYYLFTKI